MFAGGYTGIILRIDLTARTATTEPLPVEVARDFIGGAGLGVKYLFDEVDPAVDPLGPENKLVFAVGPTTGSTIPCASRMAVTAKSPLTGGVGMALSGGFFPAELKFAGYDAMIVQGRAEKPTFVWIKDGEVQFRDAAGLWGTTTVDCQQMLKDDLRDQSARILCVGPAGENLSKLACIVNERRAVGRKGLGAVMASKNLKAIAVRGSGAVAVADKDKFKAARDFMRTEMRNSPVLYSQFSKLGTPMVAEVTMALGILAGKNYSATGEFSPQEGLGVPAQLPHNIGRNPCQGCPVGCSQMRIVTGGRHKGVVAEGPEFESVYSFGSTAGIGDFDYVIAADRLCDDLGIDTMSAGAAVGFAMELYEKGILDEQAADGLDLSWGNGETLLELIRRMAFREGLGDVLADGVRAAAQRIGGDASYYAMHVKGLELPGYDVRGAKAHGLNYATSYTGADHNRGYAFQEIFGIPVPAEVDRLAYEGKGELTKWNQDVRAATCDCPTMCAFLLDMALPGSAATNTAAIMEALTGLDFTPDEVVAVGERLNNLAKVFNTQAGFTRADDLLPRRLMEEPIKEGASKGESIPRDKLDAMLDEYYAARGWDVASGTPTRAKLESLGLGYAADRLGL